MATLKYSRQRESIREFIMNCKEHPTADSVYAAIREIYPSISLGTVYRNLSLLVELGEITRVSTGGGPDRFDCCTQPHSHFICTHCSNVIDIKDSEFDCVKEKVAVGFNGEITGHMTTFFGICKDCLDKKNIKKSS